MAPKISGHGSKGVMPLSPLAIGIRLRHARLVKGLLIKDLEERIGVSISLI